MTEYKNKPVPPEAKKIGDFVDLGIYALGMTRFLVDKEGIVYLSYKFKDKSKEPDLDDDDLNVTRDLMF